MTRAAIGLGSNLDHRLTHLQEAVAALERLGTVAAVSSLYESEPVGGPRQGAFLNAVVVVETELSARELLVELQTIEASTGRLREVKWGPRTLDLDLLLYGAERHETPELEVPHPRLHQRRFVLEPLVEVWPDAPLVGESFPDLLGAVADQKVKVIARQWTAGVPKLIDRGESWVIAQMVLLALWLAVTAATGRLTAPARLDSWLGAALAGGGLVLALASWRALGRSLTPFPAPAQGGRLVETGPYRFLRHPIYTGVVMVLVGTGGAFRSGPGMVVGMSLLVFFAAKSRYEEGRLRLVYPGYESYQKRVRYRLIPGLW